MTPKYPRYLPDRDQVNDWYLDEDVTLQLHNGNWITVKKGFKWDSHSVPWWAQLVLPRYAGNDIWAAFVHDVLIASEHWLPYTRAFQDYEYKRWHNMPDYTVSRFRQAAMPFGVRVWGFLKYDIWGDYRGEIIDGDHVHYVIVGVEKMI